MSGCLVCGDDAFDEMDGLFFCATCQTQSQHIRAEEGADFVATRGLSLSTAGLKSASKARSRKQNDDGRPWDIVEAFTLILKAQVDALLRLGVNPKLKDVVFKLWSRFLALIGSAFNTPDEDVLLLKMVADMKPRDRDLRSSSIMNPRIKSVRLRRTLRRKNKDGLMHADIYKRQLEATLGSEEFYEGDNPLMDDQDGDDEGNQTGLASGDDEDDETRGESYGLSDTTLGQSISRLSLRSLVSILHLGLLYCHNNVTTADLYRWIISGVLPYKNSNAILPDNMKFNSSDSQIFTNATVPTPYYIRRHTGHLVKFMNRTHLPLVDLRVLASKYVLQLALPGELQALVTSLVEKAGPMMDVSQVHCKTSSVIQAPEQVAMATVVILLKMLFVLDDYHTEKISCYARAVNAACPSLWLFVWEDWELYRKPNKAGRTELPRNFSQVLQVRDVSPGLATHKKQCDGVRYNNTRGRHDNFLRKDVREYLDRPIQALAERLQPRTRLAPLDDALQRSQLPDPTQKTLDLNTTLDLDIALEEAEDGDNSDGGRSAQNTYALSHDEIFWKSTVKYITEGRAFTEFLKRETGIMSESEEEMQGMPETLAEMPIVPETLNEASIVPETVNEMSVVSETLNETSVVPETVNEMSVVSETLNETSIVPETVNEMSVVSETLNETSVVPETVNEMSAVPETVNEKSAMPETLNEIGIVPETVEEMHILSQTLDETHTPCEMLEENSDMIPATQPASCLNPKTTPTATCHWHVDADAFKELLVLPHAGCSPYLLESRRKGSMPRAYQHCVDVCSALIECSSKELLLWIKRLEIKLFRKAFVDNKHGNAAHINPSDAAFLKRLVKS